MYFEYYMLMYINVEKLIKYKSYGSNSQLILQIMIVLID